MLTYTQILLLRVEETEIYNNINEISKLHNKTSESCSDIRIAKQDKFLLPVGCFCIVPTDKTCILISKILENCTNFSKKFKNLFG